MNQPKEKILIVEDERLVAKDIESFLLSRGYIVTDVLSSGEEAVRAAREVRPDLVLMDVKLKGALDGIEASRLIRNELDIPVIFLTAYGSEDLVQRAGAISTYGYLLKPFNETQLEINVEMALSRHRLEQRLKEAEEKLRWELAVNEALAHLSGAMIQSVFSIEDIAQLTLDQARALTGSRHGFVSVIDPANGDNIGYTLTPMMGEECRITGSEQRIRFPQGPDGRYPTLWGEALNNRRGFYTNTPDAHPAAKGIPTGHIPLKTFLAVPAFIGGEMVGLIALTNKEDPYQDRDLEGVKRLAEIYALAIHRQRKSERLQESEEQYRKLSQRQALILQSVEEGICGLDIEGKITFINQAGERLLGWTAEEIIGRDQHELIHHSRPAGSAIPQSECPILRPLMDGSPCKVQKGGFIRKDHTPLPVEYSSTPLLEDGRITGAVVTFKDISEREFLEKQVRQAQKLEAIGTLAGGIAHDFNNILGAVIGFTEMSLLDAPAGSKLRRNLDYILLSGQRAKDLVKQILAFSRQDDSERQPVELHLLIKEMVKLLRATLPATIEIRSGIQAVGLVMADPTQIHQVLINICTNAAQAIGARRGVITVTLDEVVFDAGGPLPHPELKPGRFQCFTVSDTGPGIDPEVRERIFDPFFTTKGPGEGTGLGLSVSFGIIRKHGGTITAASESGKGTTFRVYLPLMKKKAAVKTLPREFPANGQGRILLVDDEESLADVGRLMLERAGYQVTALTDPQEALQAFKSRPEDFDLVITDQTMPAMTGEELVRKIFILRPEIPVILCTGYSDSLNEKRVEAQGIRKLLLKPLEMQDLLDTVSQLLTPVPSPR